MWNMNPTYLKLSERGTITEEPITSLDQDQDEDMWCKTITSNGFMSLSQSKWDGLKFLNNDQIWRL